MSLVINTNVSSLKAQRHLNRNQFQLDRSLERLSSGLRINTAADDAAGLAISSKLESQIRSYSQAERNANDGISVAQIVDGAAAEVTGLLIRMRELATQAATDTYNPSDRAVMNVEFGSMRTEVNRIAQITEFNGTKLTSASAGTFTVQVGIGASTNDRISLDLSTFNLTSTSLGIGAAALTSATAAQSALGTIDTAISAVGSRRSVAGIVINRLQAAAANVASSRESLTAARSRIADADIAQESANLTKNNILVQAGVSVLAQANQQPALALALLG
jgi:flagellin